MLSRLVVEEQMADEQLNEDAYRQLGGRPIRFRTRHIFYVVTVACALLGIPGWMYIAGVVIGPWLFFILFVGPLILLQFVFVLLIPPLRHKLLQSKNSVSDGPPPDPNDLTHGTSA